MDTRFLLLAVLFICCASNTVANDEVPIWLVKPSECVVSKTNDYCDTTLIIELVKERVSVHLDQPCVYVNNKWIGCFNENHDPIHYPATINSDLFLHLQDAEQKTIAQTKIPFRLIQTKPQRRRVRLPWSVF